jgi:hypothetical protein
VASACSPVFRDTFAHFNSQRGEAFSIARAAYDQLQDQLAAGNIPPTFNLSP